MCIGCGGGGSFVQFAVGGIALEEGVGIPVYPKKAAPCDVVQCLAQRRAM